MTRSYESGAGHAQSSSSGSVDSIPLDDVDLLFRCLAIQRRRSLLEAVVEASEPVDVELLAERIAEIGNGAAAGSESDEELIEIGIELHHHHLPHLHDTGVLKYEPETNRVHRGERFESAIELLDRI